MDQSLSLQLLIVFAIAILFGLIVSSALYFIFIWPTREPHEPAETKDERPS